MTATAKRSLETTIEWESDREADGTALVGFPAGTVFASHMLRILAAHPGEAHDAYPPQPDGYRLVRIPRRWVRVVPGFGQRGKPVMPPFTKPLPHATPEVGIGWAWDEAEDPKTAEAYVACPLFAARLAKIGLKPVRLEPDGAAVYQFPAAWVKVRPPRELSEAQMAAARAAGQRLHARMAS